MTAVIIIIVSSSPSLSSALCFFVTAATTTAVFIIAVIYATAVSEHTAGLAFSFLIHFFVTAASIQSPLDAHLLLGYHIQQLYSWTSHSAICSYRLTLSANKSALV